jgi:hypothetical protein
MANPAEGVLPVDTFGALILNALRDGGIVGEDESPQQAQINRGFTHAQWLLSQWARKRWLTYRLAEYSFISTGALNYPVGKGQTIDINPRPDRLEYAFLRFINQGQPAQFPVDIPIEIIQSREDYSRITVKTIGTLPWRIFYDPEWPTGTLFPWPVPQASIYEVHLGFKNVLPRPQSINDKINFPPEYEAALNWCLARRMRAAYQLAVDPDINALARDALNSIRLANQAVGVLRMPRALRGRQRAYDYRGDSA